MTTTTATPAQFFSVRELAEADSATKEHTCFKSFAALIDATGYRPSLHTTAAGLRGSRLTELADRYDHFQSFRGDARRAFRY